MTVGSNTLYFTYDANGTPLTVTYNSTTYYYATNLQGDITAILNSAGTAVVSYTYDAWGNILSVTGTEKDTLGLHDPLRYRGYVYDVETNLYYLQSRYYNPEWGRFISADAYISTGQGILGHNMFAYCGNNPVGRVDPSGKCWAVILGVVGLAVIALAYWDRLPKPPVSTTPQYEATPQEKSYAATVYAEAGGQNNRTKQAVAHVMNNRIGTRADWLDIEAVLSATGQFNGYKNYMYEAAMKYYDNGICDNVIEQAAMDECLSIVIPICRGEVEDITGGALYFHSLTDPSDWAYHKYYTLVQIPGTEKFWFYK